MGREGQHIMIMKAICGLAGHRVSRRQAWNDGQNQRSNCKRCQRPLIRRESGWKALDTDAYAEERRRAGDGQG